MTQNNVGVTINDVIPVPTRAQNKYERILVGTMTMRCADFVMTHALIKFPVDTDNIQERHLFISCKRSSTE